MSGDAERDANGLTPREAAKLEGAFDKLLAACQEALLTPWGLVPFRCAQPRGSTVIAAEVPAGGEVRASGSAAEKLRPRLAAALQYAARGFHVMPLHSIAPNRACTCERAECGSAGKHPRTANGLKDATTDPETIRRWWKRWPTANVGIRTGAESDVFVLDIDTRHGGETSLGLLVAEHGLLPATLAVKTGGGGLHFYFRMVHGLGNTAGKIGGGIDVRAAGGYVVAPPSWHVSGKQYVWLPGCNPKTTPVAAAPDWLLRRATVARTRDAGAETWAAGAANSPSVWADILEQGAPEGSRNDTLARLTGYLLRTGLDVEVMYSVVRLWNECRCQPPLPDDELNRVVDSVSGRELRRLRGH